MVELVKKEERGFLRDRDIKRILSSNPEVSKNYFASIIAELLKVDEKEVNKNLKYIPQDVSFNKDLVKSEVDFVLENDLRIFNFEFNNHKTKENMNKNNAYVFELNLRQIPNSDAYKVLKPITQVCINSYDLYHKGEFIYHSLVMEEKYLLPREYTGIDFYDINLLYLYEMSYNKIKEGTNLERMLFFLICKNKSLLQDLYEGNRTMTELEKQRQLVMENIDSLLYYDRDEILPEEVRVAKKEAHESGLKEGIKKGLKQGLKQGIEQGIEQGKKEGYKESQIEFAKNMLKIGIDIKDISNITKLSISKINELK